MSTIVIVICYGIAGFFLGVPISTAMGLRAYEAIPVVQSAFLSFVFAGLGTLILVTR